MRADHIFYLSSCLQKCGCQRSFLTSKLRGGTWNLPGFSGPHSFTETLGNIPPQTQLRLQIFPSQGLLEQHPHWCLTGGLCTHLTRASYKGGTKKTRTFYKQNIISSNMKISSKRIEYEYVHFAITKRISGYSTREKKYQEIQGLTTSPNSLKFATHFCSLFDPSKLVYLYVNLHFLA